MQKKKNELCSHIKAWGNLNKYCKVKEANLKGCIPCNTKYTTFWRRKKLQTVKKKKENQWLWGTWGKDSGMSRQSPGDFQGNNNILYTL